MLIYEVARKKRHLFSRLALIYNLDLKPHKRLDVFRSKLYENRNKMRYKAILSKIELFHKQYPNLLKNERVKATVKCGSLDCPTLDPQNE